MSRKKKRQPTLTPLELRDSLTGKPIPHVYTHLGVRVQKFTRGNIAQMNPWWYWLPEDFKGRYMRQYRTKKAMWAFLQAIEDGVPLHQIVIDEKPLKSPAKKYGETAKRSKNGQQEFA